MLSVYSFAPVLVPLLILWVVTLVNQNHSSKPEELANWDNGMTTTVLRRTL